MVDGVVIEPVERSEKGQCCHEFRKKWIPGFGSIFSSAADVFSDWYFFYRVLQDASGVDLEIFKVPLLAFCTVSTLFLFLALVTYFVQAGDPRKEVPLVDCIKRIVCCCKKDMETGTFLNVMEDFFEDIPQIVLTAMVEITRRGATPAGVLNITTSAFNLVYNLLNTFRPREEKHCEKCANNEECKGLV